MLGFVQNWFAQKANPIGVDFGSDAIRLAQVQYVGNEYRLVAAATADIPSHVRHDPAGRLAYFVETTRDLLAQGNFRGRQAVLAMPAASMSIQHLRVPKMDDEALKKALPWEVRGKLPMDPTQALIRHHVAGDVYQDQEARSEVIVMAAARELVNQLLTAAARARLDVVGMNVEPKTIVDCFGHIYRRKTDADVTNCFVDIGFSATRAIIARGGHVLFARAIPIGGEAFTRAAAAAMKIGFEDAKMLRIKMGLAMPNLDEHREKQVIADRAKEKPAETLEEAFPVLGVRLAAQERRVGGEDGPAAGVAVMEAPAEEEEAAPAVGAEEGRAVQDAVREPLNRLVEELDLCRRYYEATFPSRPVERLIFVGGEARQRGLCQHIAREMGLAAQVGDPMVRMGRVSEVGMESGIDRRQPQPGWAVAIGLSLGPAGVQGAGEVRT